MRRVSTPYLAIIATTFAGIPMAADAAPRVEFDGPARLTIRIYDYASVPGKTLARAIYETENIYRKAGVAVTMMRCRVALTDPVLDPRCGEVPGPAVIRIRILSGEMAELARLDQRVFGFAMTPREPDFGVIANVFQERVDKLAADTDAHEGVVLGHVIAHEAGHLLLGMNGHARRGIMHIPWNEAELAAAHMGSLIFTREQATKIRRAAAERIRAGSASGQPQAVFAENQPVLAARPGL